MIRIFVCFIFLQFLAVSASASAKELSITLTGKIEWAVAETARKNFLSFLDEKTLEIQTKAPELKWPQEEKTFPEIMVKYFMSTSQHYKNREASCDFFRDIAENAKNPGISKQVKELTNNGAFCISRDLAAEERRQWQRRVIDFLWSQPWLTIAGKNISLFEHLQSTMKIPLQASEVTIHFLESVPFDAYGFAKSEKDQQLVVGHPLLAEVLHKTRNFSPNDPSSAFQFGPQISQLVKEEPLSLAAVFVQKPTIYITDNWAPVDLPEVLAHELGHVVHGLSGTLFAERDQQLFIDKDYVHVEAAGEAFAWQGLCQIYPQYPALMYAHILKLKNMATFRPNDQHLLGAIAFAPDFHFTCGKVSEYHSLVKAASLLEFQRPYQHLQKTGKTDDFVLKFEWE